MIELRNLSKHFTTIDGPVDALNHINLTINNGDIYGIIGMSGAGKSTLVRCINMLERPTEGTVLMDGVDLGTLSTKEIQKVRRRITMIFQSFNLLMQRTCLENIMLPLKLAHVPAAQARAKAMELLEKTQVQIQREKDESLREAFNKVSDVVLITASKLIEKEMTMEDHKEIIEKILDDVKIEVR